MIPSFTLGSFMAIVCTSHFVTSSSLIEVRSMSKYKSMKYNTTRDEKKYLIVKGKADDYDSTKMPYQRSLAHRRQGLMGMPNIKKSKSGEKAGFAYFKKDEFKSIFQSLKKKSSFHQ